MADPRKTQIDNALAANWITIWQSEWAAVAVDREVQEAWARMAAQVGPAPCPPAPADAAPGSARPAPPAWPTAAADAPDARDAAVAALLDRVAELERRVASAADRAGR